MKSNSEITEHGSFTCPVLNHVKELYAEVSELRKLLTNIKQPSPPLDNTDLMQRYHISRTTAAEWRAHGLEYSRIGKKIYYRQEGIDIFLLKHRHRSF